MHNSVFFQKKLVRTLCKHVLMKQAVYLKRLAYNAKRSYYMLTTNESPYIHQIMSTSSSAAWSEALLKKSTGYFQ